MNVEGAGGREVRITDLSHDGRGMARAGDKVVFVRDALPGELVRYRARRRRGHDDEAELERVLEPSPDRVEAGCPHFGICGGCTLQHLDIAAQVSAKQDMVAGTLQRLGRVMPERWREPVTGPEWGYRRRARLSVKDVPRRGVVVGFRERGGFVADLDRCPVLEPAVGERLAGLARLIDGLEARARVAQVEVACGDNAAALVFRHLGELPGADLERLSAFGARHGFAIWLQPGGTETAAPLQDDTPLLQYRLPEHDVKLQFLPVDFVQVNAYINTRIVTHVVDALEPGPGERVLDLFCGLGNFSLPLGRRAGSVLGVDGDEALLSRAAGNARLNGLGNVRFRAADLSSTGANPDWLREAPAKVLLDPPRSGARVALNHFRRQGPARMVYVSCHPGTLARDAGFLVGELGYRFLECRVFDMFPHTAHVETMAVFENKQ